MVDYFSSKPTNKQELNEIKERKSREQKNLLVFFYRFVVATFLPLSIYLLWCVVQTVNQIECLGASTIHLYK
jgi:hypothetical protein